MYGTENSSRISSVMNGSEPTASLPLAMQAFGTVLK